MDTNGVASYRHRRTPSSDRFLNVFSPPSTGVMSGGSSVDGDELNEDDVFWTGDFTEPKRQPNSASDAVRISQNPHRHSFRQQEKSGILAALQDDNRRLNRPVGPVLYRTPSISAASSPAKTATTPPSASRIIPAIPRPPHEREFAQSMPMRKQSAPMNVPIFSRKVTNNELADVDIGDDEDEEMLPPHEIVARGSSNSPKTTHSVLEGVGRTLKGRDLRRVRNAVFHKTGFLD